MRYMKRPSITITEIRYGALSDDSSKVLCYQEIFPQAA